MSLADCLRKLPHFTEDERREILAGQEIRESFLEMLDEAVEEIVASYAVEKTAA